MKRLTRSLMTSIIFVCNFAAILKNMELPYRDVLIAINANIMLCPRSPQRAGTHWKERFASATTM